MQREIAKMTNIESHSVPIHHYSGRLPVEQRYRHGSS
jgi:hypothetical protein